MGSRLEPLTRERSKPAVPFGGKYRITSANHTLDSGGFRTSFEVRKEIWLGGFRYPTSTSGLIRAQGQTL